MELRLTVPPALDGERVDRGVALLAGLSRSQATRLVEDGFVRLGGRVTTTRGRRLRRGELLEAGFPAGHGPGTGAQASPSPEEGAQLGAGCIVFADQDVIVVDKPAGLVVHPGAGNREGTLVHHLLSLFPDIASAGPGADRPGIVHRLDKGTSGLLVVARTEAAREDLAAQLAARSVERRYLAVTYGWLEADEGVVEAPVGRSHPWRAKMAVVEGGRPARTRYRALSRADRLLPASLVTCQLETGRTHQVRVHLAAIGHPLLADERYANSGLLRTSQELLPELKRPWLHAAQLGFVHPTTRQPVAFSSPLPADLAQSLEQLGLELPAGHATYAPGSPALPPQANAGRASSGPASSGPASSGPASSGPASSGPASSGPASSGPVSSPSATSSPRTRRTSSASV